MHFVNEIPFDCLHCQRLSLLQHVQFVSICTCLRCILYCKSLEASAACLRSVARNVIASPWQTDVHYIACSLSNQEVLGSNPDKYIPDMLKANIYSDVIKANRLYSVTFKIYSVKLTCFFFNSVLRPFQGYFSSYETGQLVSGAKTSPEKNHLTHPQAELGLSHMWPLARAGLEPTPGT